MLQVVMGKQGLLGCKDQGHPNNPNSPHSAQALSPSNPGRGNSRECLYTKERTGGRQRAHATLKSWGFTNSIVEQSSKEQSSATRLLMSSSGAGDWLLQVCSARGGNPWWVPPMNTDTQAQREERETESKQSLQQAAQEDWGTMTRWDCLV